MLHAAPKQLLAGKEHKQPRQWYQVRGPYKISIRFDKKN